MHKFCTWTSVKVVLKIYLIKIYNSKLCTKIMCISYVFSKIESCGNVNFLKMESCGVGGCVGNVCAPNACALDRRAPWQLAKLVLK